MEAIFTLSHNTEVATELTVKDESRKLTRSMWIAFWTNLTFAIIEFFGGLLTNSVTVLSDAIHDFGDSLVIGLSLLLEKKSNKGITEKYNFGQRRFSILAALLTSTILIIGSVFIAIAAVKRFIHIESVATNGVIGLALLGILCNGFAAVRLMKDSKQSLNHKGIMLHLVEDVLGWVAVLIGAIVMHYTQWFWIDPLLSLIIAFIILWNACKNMKEAFDILLQARPKGFNHSLFSQQVHDLQQVAYIDALKCWSLDGTKHVLTMKIFSVADFDKYQIPTLRAAIDKILKEHNIEISSVEIY